MEFMKLLLSLFLLTSMNLQASTNEATESLESSDDSISKLEIPTPKMAVSLDLSQDSDRKWSVAYQAGNDKGMLMELTPEGQSAKEWDELITSNVSFGVPLDGYVKAWEEMIVSGGGKIASQEKLEDGSLLTKYTSPQENGIFRHYEGPDAVYGVSYQTRPETEDAQRVELFDGILKSVKFLDNPFSLKAVDKTP